METLISIAVGIGLAAACGFRIFVPLLVLGAAHRAGHIPLNAGFEWLSSLPALLALGTATLIEIGAYYVPWLDHALDVIAGPAAIAAGMVASASVFVDLPPAARWTTAVVGGGGAAGLVKGASALARLKSLAVTGGFGNPLVATAELVGAVATAFLAVAIPLLVLGLLATACVTLCVVSGRMLFGRTVGP